MITYIIIVTIRPRGETIWVSVHVVLHIVFEYIAICDYTLVNNITSRLMVVSHKAKKKQYVYVIASSGLRNH